MWSRSLLSTQLRCHKGAQRLLSKSTDFNSSQKLLTIALVGRPNTGKSTLFNRFTKSKLAIVSSVPGTTRDRREGKGALVGLPLHVIDTGGLDDRGMISVQIQDQVKMSFQQADVIAFMLDSREGVTALDIHFANWLRKHVGEASGSNKKDIIVIANKAEGAHMSDMIMDTMAEALKLGLGDPIPISASHGDGLADLAIALIDIAKKRGFDDGSEVVEKRRSKKVAPAPVADTGLDDAVIVENKHPSYPVEDRVIQLAIMGRPNVGKSTFINSLLQENRMIAGPTPGLTRDSIHVEWTFKDRQFLLVDTAGLTKISVDTRMLRSAEEMKRIKKMEAAGRFVEKLPGMEFMDPELDPSQFSSHVSELALMSALNSLRFSQVVVLMVDGQQGNFSNIDLQLARKCMEEGRAVVIAANKADLVRQSGVTTGKYEEGVRKHCEAFMSEFGDVPVVACCATEGQGVHRVLSAVIQTHDAWSSRLPTWVLNKWLKDLMVTAPTPRHAGRKVHIKYITQVKSRPPTFALFCNSSEIPGSFSRFLRSKLQVDMRLEGVPVRFVVRKSKGAEVKKHLLKQGKHTRRGTGRSSARPVGLKRKAGSALRTVRKERDARRRRDTRVNNQRSK